MIKNIGIIYHPVRKKASYIASLLEKFFAEHLVKVEFSLPLLDWKALNLERYGEIDLVVSIGGDGTLIRVSHVILKHKFNVPIWSIAAGEFNFMPDGIDVVDIKKAVELLLEGKFQQLYKPIMGITLSSEFNSINTSVNYYFINDLILVKKNPLDILDVSIFIDDYKLSTIKGDGVVVATSSGSTAYSLSAGGPIIDERAMVYVINMLNPHHITTRPIVLNNSRVTKICVGEKPWHLLMDGVYDFVFEENGCLEVSLLKEFQLSYIHVDYFYSWVSNVRNKFHWGSRDVKGNCS